MDLKFLLFKLALTAFCTSSLLLAGAKLSKLKLHEDVAGLILLGLIVAAIAMAVFIACAYTPQYLCA